MPFSSKSQPIYCCAKSIVIGLMDISVGLAIPLFADIFLDRLGVQTLSSRQQCLYSQSVHEQLIFKERLCYALSVAVSGCAIMVTRRWFGEEHLAAVYTCFSGVQNILIYYAVSSVLHKLRPHIWSAEWVLSLQALAFSFEVLVTREAFNPSRAVELAGSV